MTLRHQKVDADASACRNNLNIWPSSDLDLDTTTFKMLSVHPAKGKEYLQKI